MGISTIASLYSAISYMGTPSEYFTHGAKFAVQMLAAFPSAVVVIFVFMPFYHRLQVYTAYEYLEKRFSVTVRSLASSVFILWRILWMGTAIYVPSLVLHTVTGFALIETIVAVGVVATLYTVLGGMRAVIWTDVVQFFVLFCGSILALWVVSSAVGGISGIWTVAEAGGRTRVLDWSLDPTVRITTWGAFLSGLVAHLGTYGTDQVSVQRYLSARSLKVMQQSFLMNMGGGFPLGLMMISIGLGLFAFYHLNPRPVAGRHPGGPGLSLLHRQPDAGRIAGDHDRGHPGGGHVFDRFGAEFGDHGHHERFRQALRLVPGLDFALVARAGFGGIWPSRDC